MNDLGKRLRQLREEKQMSQAQLAEIFGKSQVAISKYENGNRQLDYEMLNRYSKFFNVSTDYLTGRTNLPNEVRLNVADWPPVLKFLAKAPAGSDIFLPLIKKDFSKEYTTQDLSSWVEKKLREHGIKDFIRSIEAIDDAELKKEGQFLISYIPLEYIAEDRSLFECAEYLNNNHEKIFQEDNSSYNEKGELVIDKPNNRIPEQREQKEKQEPKLPTNCVPVDFNKMQRIPLLGQVAAGLPLYAEENIEGYTYTELNGGAEYFALRVKGDSMDAMGIKDGYIVIVRRQSIVEDGEVAVVMVDDENATMKRFYRADRMVTLLPQSNNPEHKPQIYDLAKTKVEVIGKVVKVEFML